MGKRNRVYTDTGIQEMSTGTSLPTVVAAVAAVGEADKRNRRFTDTDSAAEATSSKRGRQFSSEQIAAYQAGDWKPRVEKPAEQTGTTSDTPVSPTTNRDEWDARVRERYRQRQEDPATRLHTLENSLDVQKARVEEIGKTLQETPVTPYRGWWVEDTSPRAALVKERDALLQERAELEEQIVQAKKDLYVIPGATEARQGALDSLEGQARSLTDSASLLQQLYTSVNGVLQMEQDESLDTGEASVRIQQAKNTLNQIRSNVEYAQRYFQKQGEAVNQTGVNEITSQLLSTVEEMQSGLDEAGDWLAGKLDYQAKEDSNWLWHHLSTLVDSVVLGVLGVGDNLLKLGDLAASPFTDQPLFQSSHDALRQEREQLANTLQYASGAERTLNTLAEVTGGTLPALAMSLLTGGASTAAGATNAVGGASAALYGTAATGSFSQALGSSLSSLISNPNFWMSTLPTVGGTYTEAKEEGATDWEAATTAVLNGILGGAIEIGDMNMLPDNVSQWISGGLQSLPRSTRGILDWVRSAVAEGNEEVLQSITQNALSKLVYDTDRPVFSTTDENAVVNPVRAAKELAIGAAVGGLLGLPQLQPSQILYEMRSVSDLVAVGAQVREQGTLPDLLAVADTAVASSPTRAMAEEIRARQAQGEIVTDEQIGTFGRQLLSDVVSAESGSQTGGGNGGIASTEEVTPSVNRLLRDVSAATGRRIEQVDTLENGQNGLYDPATGTLYISTSARQPLLTVLGHELTHSAEAAEIYGRLQRYVLNSVAFENDLSALRTDLETLVNATTELYAAHGITLDREGALREIVADHLAGRLFRDETSVRQLVQADRSLGQRIRGFLRRLRVRLTGTAAQRELLRIEQLFQTALRQSKTAAPTGSAAASIQTDALGNRYVHVDTDQHLFDGVPENQYPKIAEAYIRSQFKGKVLPVAQDSAYINGTSAREYGHPANRRMTSEVRNAKMRASTELDNLLAVSEYIGHAADDGRHPEATGGWDNYKTTFELDGRFFEGIVEVMNTDKGRLFYDVSKIKEIPRNVGQTEPVSAAASGDLDKSASREAETGTGPEAHGDTFSNTSVAQGNTGVNTSIRENASGMQETVSSAFPSSPDTDVVFGAESAETGFAQGENDTYASIGTGTVAEEWAERLRRYGPVRAEVSVDRQVPAQVEPDTRVSRGAATAMGYGALGEDTQAALRETILEGRASYTPVSDEAARQRAQAILQAKGAENAERSLQEKLAGDKRVTKADIATAELLVQEAITRGDYETAARLIADASVAASRAGQAVQAFSLFKKLTPSGQVQNLQRQVDQMNNRFLFRERQAVRNAEKIRACQEQIAALEDQAKEGTLDTESAMRQILPLQKQIARLGGGLTLSRLQTERILSQRSKAELEEAVRQVSAQIAEAIPVSGMDRFNAWRFFSMLANPTTHIRNLLGNVSMGVSVMAKDIAAATMEAGADRGAKALGKDGIARTKSLRAFDPRERARYRDLVDQQYFRMQEVLQGNGKEGYLNQFLSDRKIFGDTKLEDVRRWAMDLLEREDGLFLRFHYREAMYQYLTANRVDPDNVSPDTLQRANDYAVSEALKATFRDASSAAKILNGISRKYQKTVGLVIEGNLPFKNTPINILKRGVEYSPLGLLHTVYNAVQAGRGESGFDAARVIDSLASSLTGAALTALGAWLASQGVLTGLLGDDKEDKFRQLQGEQSYALNLGDTSYTIDWLAPNSMPLFVGVELWERFKDGTEGMQFKDWTESLSHLLEPVTQMSMLQGLSDTLDSVGYEDNKLQAVLETSLQNYVSQLFPTLLGKVSNILDDTRRQTFVDRNSPLPEDLQAAFWQTVKKIPGVSTTMQPYINEWGEEETEDNVIVRILENLVSPGYASERDASAMEQELQRLYDETGETSVLPSRPSQSTQLDGKYLTGDQYTEYSKIRGSTAKETMERLTASASYKRLSEEDKVKAVERVYTFAREVADNRVGGKELSAFSENARRAPASFGLSTAEYIVFYTQFLQLRSTDKQSKQEQAVQLIDSLPITRRQKDALYMSEYKESTLDKNRIW